MKEPKRAKNEKEHRAKEKGKNERGKEREKEKKKGILKSQLVTTISPLCEWVCELGNQLKIK